MKVIDLPVESLKEAPWNPNKMDAAMTARLRTSLTRFGILQNLVVRHMTDGSYEVLGGNQRLRLLKELEYLTVPCVVVELDDAGARLLAQALNRVQGEDDLVLKAESLKKILESISQTDVIELIPETAVSLQSLASLNQDTIAGYLQNWEANQSARLKHMGFQLTPDQLDIVGQALKRMASEASKCQSGNPNVKGNALYLLCKNYLLHQDKEK